MLWSACRALPAKPMRHFRAQMLPRPESESESISTDGFRFGFRSGSRFQSFPDLETRSRFRTEAPHGRLRWKRATMSTSSSSPPPHAIIEHNDGMEVEESAHSSMSAQEVAHRPCGGEQDQILMPMRASHAQLAFLLDRLVSEVFSPEDKAIAPVLSRSANFKSAPRSAGFQLLALVERALQQHGLLPVLSRALCPTVTCLTTVCRACVLLTRFPLSRLHQCPQLWQRPV